MTRRLGVAHALVGDRLVPGDVTVDDEGRIAAVAQHPAGRAGIAAPGLVDVQVNGYAGVDVAAAAASENDGALDRMRLALARDGVTAAAPTVITGDADATLTAVRGLAATDPDAPGRARLLGTHLEGPWLSPERLGTHPARFRRDPDLASVDRLVAGHRVGLVTLAPERPGAADVIRHLVTLGVTVLLGHSDATADEARAGFALGAAGVTHLFNAMPPLHHRAAGLAGVALTRPGVVCGLIVDGHHVTPEMVALTFAAAAGRVALVTDATAASGMPDGTYLLGDVEVTLTDGAVRNADGSLAGSAATLVGCVRTSVLAGVALGTALHAASTVPADLAGRPDLGRLRPRAAADITVLDDELGVQRVLVGGQEIS